MFFRVVGAVAAGEALEFLDLAGGEFAKRTGGEAFEGEGAHFHAGQVADLVAGAGEHAADLAVLAFAERDLEDAFLAQALDHADVAAPGLEALALAVGEPDALLELFDHARFHGAVDDGAVGL